jgi:hypothetical protein
MLGILGRKAIGGEISQQLSVIGAKLEINTPRRRGAIWLGTEFFCRFSLEHLT